MNTIPNSIARLKHNALYALKGTFSHNGWHLFIHYMRRVTHLKRNTK